MREGDGTAGWAQIAPPPHAHCSGDLNGDGGKRQRAREMDGVMEGSGGQHTRCGKQV